MHSLPVFLRLAGEPVILIGDGEAANAKRRLLERAGAVVVGEAAAARVAIVADGDEAAVARLKARGVLVNAVDRPELCDFTLPAIVDRDPVIVAIGTGGASAGLAAALRQRFERLLPARLGGLAVALANARSAMRARWPEPEARRRALAEAFEGPLNPLAEPKDDAVARWLATPDAVSEVHAVAIVLRSGDPDDLTLGEARALASADTLVHGADVPDAILDRARADAVRLPWPEPRPARAGLTVTVRRA